MTIASGRIQTLDFLRGIAVMGILVANLPAFGLPDAAYFSPAAWGGTRPADVAAWFVTYVLIEGKMRGLFSLLFGASLVLVVERAEAQGRNGAAVHYRRMASLFAIGCIHLYALWWGDILAHYALCGSIAFLFVRLPTRGLLTMALLMIGWQIAQGMGLCLAVLDAQTHATAKGARLLADLALGFGTPPLGTLNTEIAAYRSGYFDILAWRWKEATTPLDLLVVLGPETLATMLLGMAAMRSGFLTGVWPRRRYRTCALVLLGISLPGYVAAGLHTALGGFRMADVILGSVFVPALLRWPAILGYAAAGIVLMRPDGRLTTRIAATGKVALTNYLGTTLAMTTIFYGYGLGMFGRLTRAELYIVAPLAWAAMIAWSKPWLDHHRHGPVESLWRLLAGDHTSNDKQ